MESRVLAPEGTGGPPDGRGFNSFPRLLSFPYQGPSGCGTPWWRVWGSNHPKMCCPELLTQPPWSLVLHLSNEGSGSGDLHGTCLVRPV